ncbi:MAG: 50S ribosomal protein L30 [Nanoarchaeota archaeon]|nr:50S ribosomal protein L30 [Nanoarchaeota archaeon]
MSEASTAESKRIVVVRVRGECKLKQGIEDTLKMLRLYKKNSCTVVPSSQTFIGMISKVKDFVTWGEIDEGTFKELIKKRGKLPGKQHLTEQYLKDKTQLDFDGFTKEFFGFKKELKDIPGLKTFFKLHPPLHGFERKGIKQPFSMGGALGYRKDKINELVMRMI